MNKIFIKSCPFCGGEPRLKKIGYHWDLWCEGGIEGNTRCLRPRIGGTNKRKIIWMWNMRPSEIREKASYKRKP